MQSSELWIVGTSGSGKRALQAALLHGSALPASDVPKDQQGSPTVPWTIDNKYYTAQACMRVLEAATTACPSTQGMPEAVVLVINALQPDTWAAAKAWHDQHDCTDAGVQLLVATHADQMNTDSGDGDAQRAAWLSEVMEWAADEQYEYIECSCTDAAVDQQLTLYGDAQGIRRVIEALHAHMWPGLVRKQAHHAAVKQANGTGTTAAAVAQQTVGTAALRASEAETGSAGQSDTAGAQQQHQQPAEQLHQLQVGVEVATAEAGRHGGLDVDEARLDALEQLMEEMAGAKGRLAHLDDATRREQAAQLALRFAALLDMDDEEDSDAEGRSNV